MTVRLATTRRLGPRRAFTLVEALVATALLAIVASACMPLLRAAAQAGDLGSGRPTEGSRIDRTLVAALAERVALRPAAFGIDAATSGRLPVAWPEDIRQGSPDMAAWPEAEVEVLVPDKAGPDAEPEVGRAEDRWIILRSGGESVARWCPVPGRTGGSRRRPRRGRGGRVGAVRRTGSCARGHAGMTLVETLVAIAITAALATAVFGWTTTAARVAHAVSSRASSEATVEAVLRAISDDLLCRDMEPSSRAAGRRPAMVSGASLTIRTRSGSPGARGPVLRRYAADDLAHELRVTDTRPDGSQAEAVLARDVSRWRVSLGERGDTLEVEIAVGDAAPVARSFVSAP